MPTNGQSRRDAMRENRHEDMRERIKNSTVLNDVVESIDKMAELAKEMRGGESPNLNVITSKINALQMVNNQRWKLIDKVLPTPKELVAHISSDQKPYEEWLDMINPKAKAKKIETAE